jgi:carboxyl-terminal processing protease
MDDPPIPPRDAAPDADANAPEPGLTAAPGPVPTQPPERSTSARPVVAVLAIAVAGTMAILLFLGGYLAGSGASSCAAPSEAFAAFCEAYAELKERYVDPLDDDQLVEGALEGMFQYGVPDPYSGYMNAEEYQNSLGDLQGSFEGIGAELAVQNTENPEDLEACPVFSETCQLVIVAPIDGSPAEAAGLKAGDVILAVDGESVHGTTIEDQVTRVRGPEGTEVTLTVLRDGEEFDLTITRAEIVLVEVESEMLTDGIGYIALHGFSANATPQFREALGDLLEDGAEQIIFDLRDNPGGYISAAQEIASEFIEEGLIFTQESAGDEVEEWEALGDGQATDESIELVLLVNGGSASASEIVAGALDETDRATLIGEPTFGKNTVQIWDELSNGGGVRITISRWFTPEHNSVAPDGVQPDIVIEVPADTPPDEDPVLERALEYLEAGASQPSKPVGGVDARPFAAPVVVGSGVIGWVPEAGLWAAWHAC